MKTISVMIPCYNEEENVVPISEAVVDVFQKELPEYDYEILFIDNCSTDKTRDLLRIYFLRSVYYKMIRKMSSVEMIEHFTGFGLYDKSFVKLLRQLDDPIPFIRGVVAEYGYKRKEIEYEQPRRRAGKTHNNWYSLYDAAMLSITSYTKVGLRIATFGGMIGAILSFIVAITYFIMKLIWWDKFPAGMIPVVIGVFGLGSIQLLFIGLLGEYVMNINTRVMHKPLVVEEERINFESNEIN